MNRVSTQFASKVVSDLLCGAQLDTIRVYSLILQLGFVSLRATNDMPTEVWVSVSGALTVDENDPLDQEPGSSPDFFALRASVLSQMYRRIGQEVTSASISDSGVLEIQLDGKTVRANADEVSLEDVWGVMSDSPEMTADHRWYVSLDDAGSLSACVPSSENGPSSD